MLGKRDFKIIARGVRQLSLPDSPGLRRRLALIIASELYMLRRRSVEESFDVDAFLADCLADEPPVVEGDSVRLQVKGQCNCLGLSHRDDCPQWVLPW